MSSAPAVLIPHSEDRIWESLSHQDAARLQLVRALLQHDHALN